MPYYKRSYKTKRGYYGRRGQRKKNIFYRRLSNKGYHMAKKALSLLNVEYKNLDVSISETPASDNESVIHLTEVAQGDSNSTRDGKSLKVVKLAIRGSIRIATGSTATRVRIVVLRKIDNNLTAPTWADYITSNVMTAPRNLNNTHNLKPLYDKVFTLDNNMWREHMFYIYKKLNMRVLFEQGNAGGDETDLEKNGLYFMAISDEIDASGNEPTITAVSRIRFIDN